MKLETSQRIVVGPKFNSGTSKACDFETRPSRQYRVESHRDPITLFLRVIFLYEIPEHM